MYMYVYLERQIINLGLYESKQRICADRLSILMKFMKQFLT